MDPERQIYLSNNNIMFGQKWFFIDKIKKNLRKKFLGKNKILEKNFLKKIVFLERKFEKHFWKRDFEKKFSTSSNYI